MEVEWLRSFLQFPDSDNAVLDDKASPRYGNNPAATVISHHCAPADNPNTTTCELFQTVLEAGLPCLLQLITVGGSL